MPHSSGVCAVGGLVLFLAIATAQEDAPPLLAGRVLGQYIRADLTGSTDPANDTQPSDFLACAASWSSYNASQPTTTDFGSYTKYPATTLINTTAVYGTGDVYTTKEGVPVASGTFTPTLTTHTVVTVITTTSSYVTISYPPPTNTPSCDFSPADCSDLYVSYISSLGLPANASVPKITPAPANSPPCPEYYYKPFSTCYVSTQTGLTEDCKLYGNSVELFYFPSRTEGAPEPTAPPTYSYAPGVTFTSPSIYLSFDYLSGLRNLPNSDIPICVTCDQGGCLTNAVGGGYSTAEEGTTISGRILTMAPQDVSSMVLNYNDAEASSVISTLVGNLPGYADLAPNISLGAVLSESLMPEPLHIDDIAHPPPRAYYLRPGGAPGCGDIVQSPKCATIFEGEYRAIISLPSQASLLQDAWATCNPAIYGVYDPPIALTEAAVADSITRPTGAPVYEPSSASYTPGPVTNLPPLAAPGTALEDNLALQTSAVRPSFPVGVDSTASEMSTAAMSETTRSQTTSKAPASSTTSTSGAAARTQPWRCVGVVSLFALYTWAF